MKKQFFIIATGLIGLSLQASAAIAFDEGANYPGEGAWSNGTNGGHGFNPWTITPTNQGGVFIGDPASAGIDGMSEESFALWSNPEGDGNNIDAVRSFTDSLGVGDTFSFQWGVNNDSDNPNSSKGFSILSGANELVNVNMGNSENIFVTNKITGSSENTDFGYGTKVMEWSFTLTDANTLAIHATSRKDGDEDFTANIDIAGNTVNGFKFYMNGVADDEHKTKRQSYFDQFEIIPEPSVGILGLLTALALVNRRRR